MQEFHGGCHCKNITYILRWPLDKGLVLAKCGCTFCTKQGAIYTGHPQATLSVTVNNPGALARYQFDTQTAYCNFCSRCGVYLFATSTIDGREYAVINVNSLNDFIAPSNIKVINLEGETTPNRLARRSHTWIGNVSMTTAGA